MGGAGTLVRQGVKVGGKKGGRAVQQGQSAAIKAGQGAKVKASQGNQSKMVGSGKFEKAGAIVGGVAGSVAGGVLDGPLPIGDIVGGIAGSKVGGKIGRQFDKRSLKKESFSNWRNELLGEEDYDKMKDARLVNYGIGHDGSDKKGSVKRAPETKVKGKTVLQKETEKKYGKNVSAIDVVRADIKSKYGKGAIYDGKKK